MTLLYLYCSLVILYLWYIASVRLYGAWPTLDMQVKIVAAPSMVLFLVFDVLLNLVLTFVFLELPREFLTTQRLTRYMRLPYDGLRRRIATGICNKFLDPFDPTGKHCE